MSTGKKIAVIVTSILAAIVFVLDAFLFMAIVEDKNVLSYFGLADNKKVVTKDKDEKEENNEISETDSIKTIEEAIIKKYNSDDDYPEVLEISDNNLFNDINLYFSSLNKKNFQYFRNDYDNDEEDEIVIVFSAFSNNWQSIFAEKGYKSEKNHIGTYVLACDKSKSDCLLYLFTIRNDGIAPTDINWRNGVMDFSCGGDGYIFYAPPIEHYKDSLYNDDAEKIKYITNYYNTFGFENVKITCTMDVYDSGDTVFVQYSSNGTSFGSLVCESNGMIEEIYSVGAKDECMILYMSRYLVEYNEELVYSEGKYLKNLSSTVFSVRSDGSLNVAEEKTVKFDETKVTDEVRDFLQNLIDELNVSNVSYDPSGFADSIKETYDKAVNTKKYLDINDCNTDMIGTVTVDEGLWLNMRTGPSTSNPYVLTNTSDANSYIKLGHNQKVEIIGCSNTTDKDNPIWLKLKVEVNGKTFEGYSSQKYIKLPDIKHVKKGTTFSINVSTNDSGCAISSSDRNVVDVEHGGELTAKNNGIVLITVKTDSGLQKTCLIAVD